ncbi:MAG: tail fiber protein [Chitinophagaceae bacterium]
MEGVIGYVTPFAGSFAPNGWMLCQGQLLTITQYTPLYSLIGTYYGGSPSTNFNLPDLQGRAIVGQGTATGLSTYAIGQKGGVQGFTMSMSQMPAHTHILSADLTPPAASASDMNTPIADVYAAPSGSEALFSADNTSNMQPYAGSVTMGNAGSGTAVVSQDPVLALNYIICVMGDYPQRQ